MIIGIQQRPTVLIVDDILVNIKLLRQALSAEYRIEVASNGRAALELAQRVQPDLILLDIMMPGMDGFEVYRHLKTDLRTHEIAVIFLTAMNTPDREIQGLELGAVDYITKPFVISVVKARIRNQLKQKASLALPSATPYRQQISKWQHNKVDLDQRVHSTRLGLMGEMASGMAHEINQPLSALTAYTQVSLNLIHAVNPDMTKLAEIAVKTQQQALRAGHIMHRMKSFCKAKAQQKSLVNMNRLIKKCVNLCADKLKRNSIKLILELENELPSTHVDQIQLEQVLLNLIQNSIEALLCSPGNQQRQIIIQSNLTLSHTIQVKITDNGPGIDENLQQKILMPFYTTKVDGMGMGLSTSRSLIEAHNGSLRFNSETGKGAVFYFTLPVS
ncbi:MAG: hypothetical protein RIQ94_1502 [Pseudomonadota bacterium]|jgi:signal transduction histidine kinase